MTQIIEHNRKTHKMLRYVMLTKGCRQYTTVVRRPVIKSKMPKGLLLSLFIKCVGLWRSQVAYRSLWIFERGVWI